MRVDRDSVPPEFQSWVAVDAIEAVKPAGIPGKTTIIYLRSGSHVYSDEYVSTILKRIREKTSGEGRGS